MTDIPNTPEGIQGSLVHFDFVEFTENNYRGVEQSDADPKDGYIVYNDHRKDFGYGTFRRSDDYTVDYDVLSYIREQHPGFVPYIQQCSGFYMGGTWHPVTETAEFSQEER